MERTKSSLQVRPSVFTSLCCSQLSKLPKPDSATFTSPSQATGRLFSGNPSLAPPLMNSKLRDRRSGMHPGARLEACAPLGMMVSSPPLSSISSLLRRAHRLGGSESEEGVGGWLSRPHPHLRPRCLCWAHLWKHCTTVARKKLEMMAAMDAARQRR